jgi:hypothetical protein
VVVYLAAMWPWKVGWFPSQEGSRTKGNLDTVLKPCSDSLAIKARRVGDHEIIIALKPCVERLRGNSYGED